MKSVLPVSTNSESAGPPSRSAVAVVRAVERHDVGVAGRAVVENAKRRARAREGEAGDARRELARHAGAAAGELEADDPRAVGIDIVERQLAEIVDPDDLHRFLDAALGVVEHEVVAGADRAEVEVEACRPRPTVAAVPSVLRGRERLRQPRGDLVELVLRLDQRLVAQLDQAGELAALQRVLGRQVEPEARRRDQRQRADRVLGRHPGCRSNSAVICPPA